MSACRAPAPEMDNDLFLPAALRQRAIDYPERLVLPAADLLSVFYDALGGLVLPHEDVLEILRQIVVVLLNNDEKTEDGLLRLPDVNRLVYFNRIENRELLERAEQFASFRRAVLALACAVRDRLVEFGAYSDKEFPYFLDTMLGADLVLSHLPW